MFSHDLCCAACQQPYMDIVVLLEAGYPEWWYTVLASLTFSRPEITDKEEREVAGKVAFKEYFGNHSTKRRDVVTSRLELVRMIHADYKIPIIPEDQQER